MVTHYDSSQPVIHNNIHTSMDDIEDASQLIDKQCNNHFIIIL